MCSVFSYWHVRYFPSYIVFLDIICSVFSHILIIPNSCLEYDRLLRGKGEGFDYNKSVIIFFDLPFLVLPRRHSLPQNSVHSGKRSKIDEKARSYLFIILKMSRYVLIIWNKWIEFHYKNTKKGNPWRNIFLT